MRIKKSKTLDTDCTIRLHAGYATAPMLWLYIYVCIREDIQSETQRPSHRIRALKAYLCYVRNTRYWHYRWQRVSDCEKTQCKKILRYLTVLDVCLTVSATYVTVPSLFVWQMLTVQWATILRTILFISLLEYAVAKI